MLRALSLCKGRHIAAVDHIAPAVGRAKQMWEYTHALKYRGMAITHFVIVDNMGVPIWEAQGQGALLAPCPCAWAIAARAAAAPCARLGSAQAGQTPGCPPRQSPGRRRFASA